MMNKERIRKGRYQMEQKQLEGEPAIPDALNPTPQTEDAAEAIEQEESQFLAEQLAKA